MDSKFFVSSSPHIRSDVSTKTIMWSVVLALCPALVGAIYFYGFKALILTIIGIIGAVAGEALIQKFAKKPITITDGSAVITGMLVTFNVPPDVPYWMPFVGSLFGIIFGKMVFGGLGNNIVNPALLGRAFLMASWPVEMTTKWLAPRGGNICGFAPNTPYEAVTSATPLGVLKTHAGKAFADAAAVLSDTLATPDQITMANEKITYAKGLVEQLYSHWFDMFIGNIGGVVGETSALLLLVGFIFLLVRGFVDWRIPVAFIGTAALFGFFAGDPSGEFFSMNVLFYIFSGGLILGALFMATDMVTTPITPLGRWIFGIGCGLLTFIIRRWGGYPEGVSYSILLMNLTVPLINRHTAPKKFGALPKPAK